MKKSKYIISAILAAAAIFILASGAGADDFIFKYRDDAVVPLGLNDDVDAEYLAFGMYTCDDEAKLEELYRQGLIEFYEPNAEVYLMDDTNDQYYNSSQKYYEFALTNAVSAVNNGEYTGRGVRIGIIDSGIAPNHEDIDYDKIVAQKDIIGKSNSVTDTRGHGTMVTGIIAAQTNNTWGTASLAPDADLVIIRAFMNSSDGKAVSTKVTHIIESINFAIEQKCDVINMSLGISNISVGDLYSLKTAINEADANGIILVAASGNHDSETPDNPGTDSPYMYPASFDNVVSVASVDSTAARSSFSFHNNKVNISACGDNVRGLSMTGGYTRSSGTSFSTPFITSVAALAKQIDPDMTTEEFLDLLDATASEAAEVESDYRSSYGSGIVNVGKLLDTLLGINITVGDAELGSDWHTRSVMTNNGFDSYNIMDMWFMSLDEAHSRSRIKHITLDARSSITVEYQGWYTVNHIVWLEDGLVPLRTKDSLDTGIV